MLNTPIVPTHNTYTPLLEVHTPLEIQTFRLCGIIYAIPLLEFHMVSLPSTAPIPSGISIRSKNSKYLKIQRSKRLSYSFLEKLKVSFTAFITINGKLS